MFERLFSNDVKKEEKIQPSLLKEAIKSASKRNNDFDYNQPIALFIRKEEK